MLEKWKGKPLCYGQHRCQVSEMKDNGNMPDWKPAVSYRRVNIKSLQKQKAQKWEVLKCVKCHQLMPVYATLLKK